MLHVALTSSSQYGDHVRVTILIHTRSLTRLQWWRLPFSMSNLVLPPQSLFLRWGLFLLPL